MAETWCHWQSVTGFAPKKCKTEARHGGHTYKLDSREAEAGSLLCKSPSQRKRNTWREEEGENGESCREELGAEGNRDLAERGKQA